jgi:hypothetical protein
MKLGATDFVRKPLTPEVLRSSVAAALAKSPAPRGAATPTAAATAPEPLLIQTITMNGFTILDDESCLLEEGHRRFVVVSPEGERHDVLVEIESEPIDYVERMTGRHLKADNSFWTAQARRLLSDFLWNEGKVPAMRRLVLKFLDPDKLPIAARWKKK